MRVALMTSLLAAAQPLPDHRRDRRRLDALGIVGMGDGADAELRAFHQQRAAAQQAMADAEGLGTPFGDRRLAIEIVAEGGGAAEARLGLEQRKALEPVLAIKLRQRQA